MPTVYCCFLDNDTELMEKHWLNRMAAKVAPPSGDLPAKIHVELFFPAQDDDGSSEVVKGEACSIHYNNKVFLSKKRFSRVQWTFRSMDLTDEQFEQVYNYCKAHVGCSFNHVGYFLQPFHKWLDIRHDWPQKFGDYKPRYFCSEICIEALKAGNVLPQSCKSNIHPQEMFKLLEDGTTRGCVRNVNQLAFNF